MKNYLDLMKKILNEGEVRGDRTNTGTYSLFGETLEFDLKDSFPAVTTKKLFFRGVVEELLWMLSGSTNVKDLQDKNVHIWDEWADENGELGPVYGKQWCSWEAADSKPGDRLWIDQISNLVDSLKNNPNSRRHIVSAWNVADLPDMALPPCHVLSQYYVNKDGLSCLMYQRSCDYFLGAPFNIAQYALLTHLLAQTVGLPVNRLIITYGDVHIYLNHLHQCVEQIRRVPKTCKATLALRCGTAIGGCLTADDIKLHNYEHHPAIKGKIAV